MTDDNSETPASFVTFYSCKGGVGRSMALINVAGILAGRGFRVLALDMDLEAPGISYLMRPEAQAPDKGCPGFVDLLADACARGVDSDLFGLSPKEVVERYSYPYTVPEAIRSSEEGQLRIMPAGLLDDTYQTRLNDLGLGQLYRDGDGQPLIAAFKQTLQEANAFDFVFVDSRTGFSDEAGICTRDLADALMIVMGLNRQNVEGTAAFLRSLHLAGISKPLRVVLSPVPIGEDEVIDRRKADALRRLNDAHGQVLDLSLEIPYHPLLALTEEPHIFRRSRGYLFDAYVRITEAVLPLTGHTVEACVRAIQVAAKNKRVDAIVKQIRDLRRFDGGTAVLEGLAYDPLADLCLDAGAGELRRALAASLPPTSRILTRLAGTLALAKIADADLFYARAMKARWNDASFLTNYAAFSQNVMNDIMHAQTLHERALAAEPDNANVLCNYGQLLFVMGRNEEAIPLVRRARELDPPENELQCELHFYAYAHAQTHFPNSLPALTALLQSGARSKNWPLRENVRVATEQGHPVPEFLAALARVVSDEAPIETLDAFEAWRDAGIPKGLTTGVPHQRRPRPTPARRLRDP